jgi:hypothetical protein
MKEYVHHEVNGLLFKHRDPSDLAVQMGRLISDPILATRVANKGYLQSDDGHIPSIQDHVADIVLLYTKIREERSLSYV